MKGKERSEGERFEAGLSLPHEPRPGVFLERPNRYLARVELGDALVDCHVPNPGRMTELLTPGRPGLVIPADGSHRKTAYDLMALWYQEVWVYIDNRLGNRLLRWKLETGLDHPAQQLADLGGYDTIRSEVTCGKSRIDFLLTGRNVPFWLELKSCTLVEGGWAQFPDAPTGRGRRHVEELAAVCGAGQRAGVLFLIQRPDARCFRPHDATDPDFGRALREAVAAGVEVWAYTSELVGATLRWGRQIPVEL